MLEINSKLIKFTNVTLELRYRHNDLKNSKSLIESLKNYFELSIQI